MRQSIGSSINGSFVIPPCVDLKEQESQTNPMLDESLEELIALRTQLEDLKS
jgi:hypothetical protein